MCVCSLNASGAVFSTAGETVKLKLIQLIPPVGEVLAVYEDDARSFLFPEPKLVPSFSGVDCKVLMTREPTFPGISPRLEFSTRTKIKSNNKEKSKIVQASGLLLCTGRDAEVPFPLSVQELRFKPVLCGTPFPHRDRSPPPPPKLRKKCARTKTSPPRCCARTTEVLWKALRLKTNVFLVTFICRMLYSRSERHIL
ncbi:spermatogenesis associated 6-like protein isoform X3 [Ictalurus punctatus]|uniref:Spermatogenesis associated 6-like protein isoform X3 n=1 Tax=Ictalurus punctatus TaxID=7998 RepID=A0A9F7TLC7_ICTPU|nr:spermatogenesis associated 6-like protein isoform X3 [Ictalurus punctatus]XP_053537588.1 spermatogenesis associated 6-like protein isoform X3 [Ictalurus punctatus]